MHETRAWGSPKPKPTTLDTAYRTWARGREECDNEGGPSRYISEHTGIQSWTIKSLFFLRIAFSAPALKVRALPPLPEKCVIRCCRQRLVCKARLLARMKEEARAGNRVQATARERTGSRDRRKPAEADRIHACEQMRDSRRRDPALSPVASPGAHTAPKPLSLTPFTLRWHDAQPQNALILKLED